jgi:hypothetical protein
LGRGCFDNVLNSFGGFVEKKRKFYRRGKGEKQRAAEVSTKSSFYT